MTGEVAQAATYTARRQPQCRPRTRIGTEASFVKSTDPIAVRR